jgi:hypothetical protein
MLFRASRKVCLSLEDSFVNRSPALTNDAAVARRFNELNCGFEDEVFSSDESMLDELSDEVDADKIPLG